MEWVESIGNSISYIEKNLLEDINANDVAVSVNISPFYLQMRFGYPLKESEKLWATVIIPSPEFFTVKS